MFETIPSSMSYVRSGQLRAIAVTTEERSAQLPDVPTVQETVTGVVSRGWLGVAAPADTPKPIVDRLNGAIHKVIALPDVAKRLTDLGLQVKVSTPAAFSSFIASEVKDFHTLITDAKIPVE
jgi:tripartite-type tricarboxylate transporter receptor subunit TctC